jgi:hypothetical protein
MGFGLHTALTEAGLSVEHVRAEAIVQTPSARHDIGAIVRAILPRIVKQGVATEVEIDIDTLDRPAALWMTGIRFSFSALGRFLFSIAWTKIFHFFIAARFSGI